MALAGLPSTVQVEKNSGDWVGERTHEPPRAKGPRTRRLSCHLCSGLCCSDCFLIKSLSLSLSLSDQSTSFFEDRSSGMIDPTTFSHRTSPCIHARTAPDAAAPACTAWSALHDEEWSALNTMSAASTRQISNRAARKEKDQRACSRPQLEAHIRSPNERPTRSRHSKEHGEERPSYRCEPDVGKSQELSVREKMPQTLLLGPAPSVAASTSGRESHHRRNTASSPPCEETQPRAWADRLQGTRQTREQDEKPVRTAGRTEAEPAGPTPGWEERWTRRQETRGSVGRAPDAAPVGKESAPSARNDAVLPDYHLDAHRVGAAVRLPEPVVTGQSIPRTRHELRDGAPHVSGR